MILQVSLEAYAAARTRAAVLDRSDYGRVIVTGVDRASYFQGLLTNDVASLKAGQGCYAAHLTPQGRMIGDLIVYELGDQMLLSMVGSVKDTLLTRFDQLVFSEDVQVSDATETLAQLTVVGPEAARAIEPLLEIEGGVSLITLADYACVRVREGGAPAIVSRVVDTGEPGFDVFVPAPRRSAFGAALRAAGVASLDAVTADVIRIEDGVPLFHQDMDEDTIPLEAGIEGRAISFTKGCYVGQEVIVRVIHRGHGRVARRLVGVILDGDSVPSRGQTIVWNDAEAGHVTSSAYSPALKHPIALGYVQRDAAAAGTAVRIEGVNAIVVDLPFRSEVGRPL